MPMFADSFLIYKSKIFFADMPHRQSNSQQLSDRVVLLQTADAYRYSKILDVSSAINKAYCQRRKIFYESFRGTIFGDKPFQATYNRVALLWFLMERGYNGWVLYLDADAAISDFEFDFTNYLLNKRKAGMCFVFHPVHEAGHPLQFFGNVNAGAFAVDFSNPLVKSLILTWYSFYREYLSSEDYARAVNWLDLMDDQSSLQRILYKNRIHLEDHIAFEPIQHEYIFQALRSDHSSESSIDDIEYRINQLTDVGAKNGIFF